MTGSFIIWLRGISSGWREVGGLIMVGWDPMAVSRELISDKMA